MFDLEKNSGNTRVAASQSLDTFTGSDKEETVKVHSLDSQPMVTLHHRLLSYVALELDRHAENRAEMAEDEEFYDNNQWREEDKAELEERGQLALVYNVIATSIDWVTGSEKRARMDWKILPRNKQANHAAEQKTKLMKYLSDVNRTGFSVSDAFEDAVKAGIGWIEDGWQGDNDGDEPLYSKYEDWRYIWWDSAARDKDLGDARYMFRSKWFDEDVAQAIFDDRAYTIQRSASDAFDPAMLDAMGDEHSDSTEFEIVGSTAMRRSPDVNTYQRRRVRLTEMWFKVPMKVKKLKGGDFTGEIYDPYSRAHKDQVDQGKAELRTATSFRMHVAIFTSVGLLYYGESPYRHNRYPFTPIIAYKRKKNGLPYGMIRRMKSLQEDINKRASKALAILSTNKIIMDEGAIGDDMTPDELLEEAARPDSLIVKRPGKELKFNNERELSQWHLELMQRSIQMVQSASGVTDENLGRRTNASSGIAIQRRQDQGALATLKLFDNLAFAQQVRGEKVLANIEQFMDEPKQFRITSSRGQPEYVSINDPQDPEGSDPITATKADFIVSETEFQATIRQAQAMELMEVMRTFPPQISMAILDLVIEATEIPNRDEIVQRIRQLTGQKDPDADPNEKTPEQAQTEEAAAKAAAFQEQMAMAELKKKLAEADRATAQAQQVAASIVGNNIDAQKKAIETAREAMATPQIADMADHIMHESGFVDRATKEAALNAAMQQNQPMPPQPTPDQADPAAPPMQPPSQAMPSMQGQA